MNIEAPARPTRALRPARRISPVELRLRKLDGDAPPLVDVREAAAFHARHIAGSQHGPDSQTTALVRKIQTFPNAILVCEDGRTSAMVARTLGACGFREIAVLEGGLAGWVCAGGKLVETTRSGFEHELLDDVPAAPPPAEPPKRDVFGVLRSWLGATFARPDTGSTPSG